MEDPISLTDNISADIFSAIMSIRRTLCSLKTCKGEETQPKQK